MLVDKVIELMLGKRREIDKYVLDTINSEIDFYIIHDNKGNTYEYHPDTKDVFAINRYNGDQGEIINDDIAKEIRNFCDEEFQ